MQKKTISLILSGVVFMSFLQMDMLAAKAADAAEIYVSPKGDDGNGGTPDMPLKTLAAAKSAARQAAKDGDVAIILRGGEYAISETFEFTSEDGGADGHSVTWKGYENETPVISSMTDIKGWSLYDGENNIYCADVPEGFNTRQVYVNGEKAPRSRNISYSGNTYEHLKRTCELGLDSRTNTHTRFTRTSERRAYPRFRIR